MHSNHNVVTLRDPIATWAWKGTGASTDAARLKRVNAHPHSGPRTPARRPNRLKTRSLRRNSAVLALTPLVMAVELRLDSSDTFPIQPPARRCRFVVAV